MKSNHYEKNIIEIDLEIRKLIDISKTRVLTSIEAEQLDYWVDLRLKLQESEAKRDGVKLNKNTILAAGVNIAGLLLVLNYEKLDVVSSKAFSLIGRTIGK